ncbi:MAG: SDR family oxidoreductase [Rhodobacteraceae bacterium]|nr:SDR family oxidoreductase [Paracoccaceae bacterium]
MPDTPPRTALVTGASRGIGARIAEDLAADGVAVAVNYAASPDQADAVVGRITAEGGRAVALHADLAQPEAARALYDAAESALGRVGILVNNVGIMKLAPLAGTNDAMLDRHLALNLSAPFRLMREAATRLPAGGRIINFSSRVVSLWQPGYAACAAAKAAVEAVTHILAKELGPRKITVNAVAPGPVATELFLADKSPELVERIKAMNPFGRLGEPEDIAHIVCFLAGPDSGWISGQVIRANGGVV